MSASVKTRLSRIREEFAVVAADSNRGREFVAAQMEALALDSEMYNQWRAALPEALEVVATDDKRSETSFLKLFLLPDRNTIAVFFSDVHSADSASLLTRLRTALEEQVDVFSFGTRLSRQHKHHAR